MNHDARPLDHIPTARPESVRPARHVLVVSPVPVALETLRGILLGSSDTVLEVDHLDSLDQVPAVLSEGVHDVLAVDTRMDPLDLMRLLGAASRAEQHPTLVLLPAPHEAGGGTSAIFRSAARPPRDMVEEVFRHALETTESRRALRASEARFAALADVCAQGVILLDARGLVRAFNPAAERLLGGRAADRLGRDVTIALPGLRRRDREPPGDDVHPLAPARRGTCSLVDTDVLVRHADGREVSCVMRALHLPAIHVGAESPLLLLMSPSTSDPVTPTSAAHLDGARAHDLNNLLHTIRGYAELLALGVAPKDPALEHLEPLHEAIDRASRLLRSPRPAIGEAAIVSTPIGLDGVLTGLRPLLEQLLGDGIRLELDLSLGGTLLTIDAGELEQAIMNLALNARDAMGRGGRLRIVTAEVTLDVGDALLIPGSRPGRFVRLTVDDDGCGMDMHVRRQAFEPRFTTKPEGCGSGLGLSMVREFVERSGGFITLESAPSVGSRFDLYFPRERG